MRRVRHPVRLLERITFALWVWRNRHDLVRWGRFALQLPADVRARPFGDIVTEARARLALSAEPRTRTAPNLDITDFDNGQIMLQAQGEEAVGQLAQDLLCGVTGVVDVRLVNHQAPIADLSRAPHSQSPDMRS